MKAKPIQHPLTAEQRTPSHLWHLLHEAQSFGHFELICELEDTHPDDEPIYFWQCTIETRRQSVTAKDQDFLQAIHEAVEEAAKVDTAEYREREAKRAAAYAKLTPEERRLLGV